tara:strand:+ start:1514 stop:2380 length:867 start_codon:yes stop_codon:yes gene_type:complete
MSAFKKLFHRLWLYSPKENFRWIRNFLLRDKRLFKYNLNELLDSKKHLSSNVLIDRWERYLRNINTSYPNLDIYKKISLKNKIIYELGCGPLLGWGPVFLFLGAQKFIYSDPSFNKEICFSKTIEEKYFKKLYEDLISNYGNLMSYEKFIDKVKNNTKNFVKDDELMFDFVISNSVLEHIKKSEIENVLSSVFKKMSASSFFMYSVDFSDHSSFPSEIYSKKIDNNNPSLNFLRQSEITNLIEKAGFKLLAIVTNRVLNLEDKKIHNDWIKYDKDDLKVMNAIYFGSK